MEIINFISELFGYTGKKNSDRVNFFYDKYGNWGNENYSLVGKSTFIIGLILILIFFIFFQKFEVYTKLRVLTELNLIDLLQSYNRDLLSTKYNELSNYQLLGIFQYLIVWFSIHILYLICGIINGTLLIIEIPLRILEYIDLIDRKNEWYSNIQITFNFLNSQLKYLYDIEIFNQFDKNYTVSFNEKLVNLINFICFLVIVILIINKRRQVYQKDLNILNMNEYYIWYRGFIDYQLRKRNFFIVVRYIGNMDFIKNYEHSKLSVNLFGIPKEYSNYFRIEVINFVWSFYFYEIKFAKIYIQFKENNEQLTKENKNKIFDYCKKLNDIRTRTIKEKFEKEEFEQLKDINNKKEKENKDKKFEEIEELKKENQRLREERNDFQSDLDDLDDLDDVSDDFK
jgi:hypothetical protein